LLHLVVNWIFLDFSKSEISRVYRPVVRSFFLFSRIIILVRFEIHFSNLLSLRHIFSRVYRLFGSPLVILSRQSKFKIRLFSRFREIIVPVHSTSKRLSLQTIVFVLFDLIYKLSDSSLVAQFHHIVRSF